ncbi:MAG: hypothetical protein JO160_00280 [Candidatus Eremiobacteraeota bacterium]|nr:hypothetical protein [Candidatus Eremiobacteraeota bacterium]
MGTVTQRGSALLETTIAVGILAVVAGAALGAGSFAAGSGARMAIRGALQDAAESELRIALDALKYDGTSLAPRTVATTVPLPGASPLPVALSLQTAPQADGSVYVTITAAARTDASQRVTLEATLDRRAPLPGTQLRAPGLVPAPTGAP